MIKGKAGENILTENIIFIVLNLVFLSIIIVFLFSKMSSAAVLEERYAKQIAMIIDSAKPSMTIELNLSDALDKLELGVDVNNVVKIDKNIVTVNLQNGGKGYSYSFFNNVEITNSYFNGDKFVLIIDRYK